MMKEQSGEEIWAVIREQLASQGIDLGELCCGSEDGTPKVKVICVSSDMSESLRELGRNPRDQVVMVRVDSETCSKLDQWVATGAARSRSEAAALFIREGLHVRADELEKLSGALRELEEAQQKLRREAKQILGEGGRDEEKG